MSHYYFKTTYKETADYASEREYTLYVNHNNSCDIVCFYDEKGDCMLCVEDTLHPNILDAMVKLMWAWKDARNNILEDGVQQMTPDEIDKIIYKTDGKDKDKTK